MTKQYPIVHLGNEMYMIDPTTDDNFKRIWGDKGYFGTMLASTDKSLNLPLLPAVDDISDDKIEQIAVDLGYTMMPEELSEGIKAGYKENTKKWEDKHLRAAMMYGVFNHESINELAFDRFLDSLKPSPLAVESQTEWLKEDYEEKNIG